MGRSVSVPSEAVEVFYLDWMPDPDDLEEMVTDSVEANDLDLCRHDRQALADELVSDEFDYLVEDLRVNVLGHLFPSVYATDRWIGREDHVIAENNLVAFGVSEYCGLASVWVVVNDDETEGLARRWIAQAWPKVEAMFPHRLGLMGRFSNGEAVYQRVAG